MSDETVTQDTQDTSSEENFDSVLETLTPKEEKETERLKKVISALQAKLASNETATQETPTKSEDLRGVINEQLETFKAEIISTTSRTVLEEALNKIENPKEREVTRLMYEKKLVKSGMDSASINADIQLARSMVRGHAKANIDMTDLATDLSGGSSSRQSKAEASPYANVPREEIVKMIKFRKAAGTDASELEKLL